MVTKGGLARDDRLAIDHKLLDAVLQGGLGIPRIALGPVLATALAASCAVARALTTNHFRVFSTTNQNDFGIVSFRIG